VVDSRKVDNKKSADFATDRQLIPDKQLEGRLKAAPQRSRPSHKDKLPILFNDFNDATAAGFDDYWSVVHDRISVTRPHMILARDLIKCYATLG